MKKKYLIGLIVIIAVVPCLAIPTPWLHVEGNAIKDQNGKTVILRGVSLKDIASVDYKMVLDLITNTNDKTSSSPGWYTSMVRFPVYPKKKNDDYIEDIPDWLDYNKKILKPAIDYAAKKGLYIIIDLHYIHDTFLHTNSVNKFWEMIAPLYKDSSNVIFEPYNEPENVKQKWSQFKPIMQEWVNTIRAKAPKNLIFVSSPIWSQLMGDAATDSLTGGNVVYVVHMYPRHWESNWNKAEVEKCATVHPVVATEWGFRKGLEQWGGTHTCSGYGKPILTWMEKLGISWTAWLADDKWEPKMFNGGNPWTLRVGEGEMGGLVKDWLYKYKDSDLPSTTNINKSEISKILPEKVTFHHTSPFLTVINPAFGQKLTVRLLSLDGRSFFFNRSESGTVRIFTGNFSDGVYIVEAIAGGKLQQELVFIR